MTVAPMVTWPSPAMATLSPLLTATTVVLRILSRCMGMSPPIDFLQFLHPHVGVHLRGGKTGVAEQLLHGPYVCTPVQQVRGKGMPEGMRRHPLAQVRAGQVFAQNEPDAPIGDPPASLVDEESAESVRFLRMETAARHVLPEGAYCRGPEEHVAFLGPFSHHAGGVILQIDIREVKGDELGNTAARGIEGLQ